tara:strand:- start:820 stop:1056 length:237 start_codon:yes stop_codon:yes gene_type:complete
MRMKDVFQRIYLTEYYTNAACPMSMDIISHERMLHHMDNFNELSKKLCDIILNGIFDVKYPMKEKWIEAVKQTFHIAA